jgi:hypothetical protein
MELEKSPSAPFPAISALDGTSSRSCAPMDWGHVHGARRYRVCFQAMSHEVESATTANTTAAPHTTTAASGAPVPAG